MSALVGIDDQLCDPVLRRRSRGIDGEQPSPQAQGGAAAKRRIDCSSVRWWRTPTAIMTLKYSSVTVWSNIGLQKSCSAAVSLGSLTNIVRL